jgi:hypothetical protein
MTTKDESCVKGFLYNHLTFDPNTVKKNIGWLVNKFVKDEFALGEYNPDELGNVSHLGRVYADEEHAKKCIAKAGATSAYFTIEIPKDATLPNIKDRLNDSVEYMHVQEGTVPEVVSLSTNFGQYQITPQFDCVELRTQAPEEVSELTDAQQTLANELPLRKSV